MRSPRSFCTMAREDEKEHKDSSCDDDTDLEDLGMEDIWIMDSGCSRHRTGQRRWFSSLTPTSGKDYITFGDKGQALLIR